MAELSYQEKINRLTVIAETLEKGSTELEKAVALFEEGMALVKACENDLDDAQKRVMMLTEAGTEEPFDQESGEEEND